MKRYAIILKTIALLVIAPIVIYTLSVSKTLEALREYRKLDTGGTHVTSYSAKADTTQEGGPLLSTGAVLGSITQACSASGVSVTSYAPEMTDYADGLELWQSELVLSGRFKPLLSITDYTPWKTYMLGEFMPLLFIAVGFYVAGMMIDRFVKATMKPSMLSAIAMGVAALGLILAIIAVLIDVHGGSSSSTIDTSDYLKTYKPVKLDLDYSDFDYDYDY